MNPYTNNILEYVSFTWEHGGCWWGLPKSIGVYPSKVGDLKQGGTGGGVTWCSSTAPTRCWILLPQGSSWLQWELPGFGISQDFGCWKAKPDLGTAVLLLLQGCIHQILWLPVSTLMGLGTDRALLRGVRLIILLILRGCCCSQSSSNAGSSGN